MGLIRTCGDCSLPFPVDDPNKNFRTCLVCWKDKRGYEKTRSDEAFRKMQRAYDVVERENRTLKGRPQPRASSMTNEMLKRLIRLCHPDRHRNSDLSNEVTRWLLDRREGS